LPEWLTILNRIDPLTYGVDLLRWIMLGINNFNPLLDIILILIFALGMFAIAVFEFNMAE
jgi:ABC-2 type transport system permease protein